MTKETKKKTIIKKTMTDIGKTKKKKLNTKKITLNEKTKKKTFLQVEKIFINEMFKKTRDQTNFNICCDNNDEKDIIKMGNIIKKQSEYNFLSFRDIIFVLIYTYYSLRYNEQTENWLNLTFFDKNILTNIPLAKKLYFDITTGDILINNRNLSSYIRLHVMEMKAGKIKKCKKTLYKNINKNKTKKRLYKL